MFVRFRRGVILLLLCTVLTVSALQRHGSRARTLHISDDEDSRLEKRKIIIDRNSFELPEERNVNDRAKRDTVPPLVSNETWVNHLNDSHQQLVVHWVGEGSSVIICLARDAGPRRMGLPTPSALYISYDYGETFKNKTDSFKLDDGANGSYAQLEKFNNHPKYNSYCLFIDVKNKVLFYTSDNGIHISRIKLDFHPSEVVFDDDDPDTFVVLDKEDSGRKLYKTENRGKTFEIIEEYVKMFYWSSGPDMKKTLYLERFEPSGRSTVFQRTADDTNKTVLIDNVEDFQIKGDFMFATKKSKQNTMDLYISYQRGEFIKADFQTELDMKQFHISDVTPERLLVSVAHTNMLSNLYASEISPDYKYYKFVLSLEGIMCYFPNSTWKYSWLEWRDTVTDGSVGDVRLSDDVAEESFADLYRLEGLKGIYIASKVSVDPGARSIGPEHLTSQISFDHGATWSHIRPPREDEHGIPIKCSAKDNGCSLNLAQKFSQLHPLTRSSTIMSSKSAPGIIMATGVVGTSLKGHAGVFISRDAGASWRQVLKDYHFFNFGDHGGVLVAVKYFKARGETKEILYSTDDGETWNTKTFNENELRVYGLMTEPGENTSVFTMFGSAKSQHQWIIIKVDLFKTFAHNCTKDDYKFWAPASPEVNSRVPCVLGVTNTYQRRKPHANCYNGLNYDRPVNTQVCQCNRQDFECDYGFMPAGNPSTCIRNKTLNFDPYAIPPGCRPGHFYNRTKGYRKIDGDQCIAGYSRNYLPDTIPCPMGEVQEFLVIALRDKIARIDLQDEKFQLFPIKDLKNIIAIEFDMKNNCVYWADIETDKISRQCFSNGTSSPEILVETDLFSIEGMALDWISNVLFFVDGMRNKIEAIRTDLTSRGRMRRTILGPDHLLKPRGIAVHPTAGYLFWTDWSPENPSISRANLDGTNIVKLFTKPLVNWPNGITIDQIAERIYWVDAMQDYIASADLNGQFFKKILANDDKVAHPFAVAVLKDKMYWDDWKASSLFVADKDRGVNIRTLNSSLTGLMDVKVFAHFMQQGTNGCSGDKNNCTAMCLGAPGGISCLCPDGLNMKDGTCLCPGGAVPYANMTCPQQHKTCNSAQFACKNNLCVPSSWKCDGDNDCGDNSDEMACPESDGLELPSAPCPDGLTPCDGGEQCLPLHWRCDGEVDCSGGDDEKDCLHNNCTGGRFKCHTGKCINLDWVCDGDNDCPDGSDETNCEKRPSGSCKSDEFACNSTGQCLPLAWMCDDETDCPDASDEVAHKCANHTCPDTMFKCAGNAKCIYKKWVCDGQDDCLDMLHSDELNCNTTSTRVTIPIRFPGDNQCADWMITCANGKCAPAWWRCDGIDDCGDGSDESGCAVTTAPSTTTAMQEHTNKDKVCPKNQFMCSEDICISASWVCDGQVDCPDGADEAACATVPSRPAPPTSCAADRVPCDDASLPCIPLTAICNGIKDCSDGSDELKCSHKSDTVCGAGWLLCDQILCLQSQLVCDGHQNCYDGTDELNCNNTQHKTNNYQIHELTVDARSVTPTSFRVYWWMTQPKEPIEFLPSISKVHGNDAGVWTNGSAWTTETAYRFDKLDPYTVYNITVYIREVSTKGDGSPSYFYTPGQTAEGVPTSPSNVIARQSYGSRVEVEWNPPQNANGRLREYVVYWSPPLPPLEQRVPAHRNKTVLRGVFLPDTQYTFWVTAFNKEHESEKSEAVTLQFDSMGDVDDLQNVTVLARGDRWVTLSWPAIPGVHHYIVRLKLPLPYAVPTPSHWDTYKQYNITLKNLPPGVNLTIEVLGTKDNVLGRPLTFNIVLPGTPLPGIDTLRGELSKESGNTVKLSWQRPKEASTDVTYEVHYGTAMNKLFQEADFVTNETSWTIRNLWSCEKYFFNVGVLGGPLSGRPLPIMTRYNKRARVRNMHVEKDDTSNTLTVYWDCSCPGSMDKTSYIIDVKDVTLNATSRFRLDPTANASMTHTFRNLPYGGRYYICVTTEVENALYSCSAAFGRPIPRPHQLHAWSAPNGSLLVTWNNHENKLADEGINYYYEVLVTEDDELPDRLESSSLPSVQVFKVEQPPFVLPVSAGQHIVAVRLVSQQGYKSDLSEVFTVQVGESAAQSGTGAGGASWATGLAVSAGVVALLLTLALLQLGARHRRLRSSFARYAGGGGGGGNGSVPGATYDSRRGQATIDAQLHDDDDAPNIGGFSDDEPLVIA